MTHSSPEIATLRRVFDKISTRLNNTLCEMKSDYDDSVVGFNEAWDIMRAVFNGEFAKEMPRTPAQGPSEPAPTKEEFAKWARAWHETCETMLTLLGLPGNGSPQEMLAQVQAYVGRTPPQAASITDAMCAAAIAAYSPDRIQGFSYEKRHVIRDVSLPYEQQEIWSTPVAGPEEYQAFRDQLQLERMRLALEAALSLSRPQQPCHGPDDTFCMVCNPPLPSQDRSQGE